jgi:hypothetical protein
VNLVSHKLHDFDQEISTDPDGYQACFLTGIKQEKMVKNGVPTHTNIADQPMQSTGHTCNQPNSHGHA